MAGPEQTLRLMVNTRSFTGFICITQFEQNYGQPGMIIVRLGNKNLSICFSLIYFDHY